MVKKGHLSYSTAAIINIIAQVLAISGNQAYQDPPYYYKGIGASLGMICFTSIVAAVLVLYLKWRNAKKDIESNSEEARQLRELTVDVIGNKHPDFRFSY